MKVTLELGSEIEPAIQRHLDGGISVQDYIVGAIRLLNSAFDAKKRGSTLGYSTKNSNYMAIEIDIEAYLKPSNFKE